MINDIRKRANGGYEGFDSVGTGKLLTINAGRFHAALADIRTLLDKNDALVKFIFEIKAEFLDMLTERYGTNMGYASRIVDLLQDYAVAPEDGHDND